MLSVPHVFPPNPVSTYPLQVRDTCPLRIIHLDNYSLIRALEGLY